MFNPDRGIRSILTKHLFVLGSGFGVTLRTFPVLFLIVTLVSGSSTLLHSVSPKLQNLWQKYYSELRIRAVDKNADHFTFTSSMLLDFADSDYLRQSVAYGSVGVNSDTVQSVDISFSPCAVFQIHGDVWNDFSDGTKRITGSGHFPKGIGECLISESLASKNQILLDDILLFATTDGSHTYALTVTGFYTDISESSRNSIYTTLSTLLDEGKTQVAGVQLSVTYYLKDPSMRIPFEAELRQKGLPESYSVQPDYFAFERASGSLSKIRTSALIVLFSILPFGCLYFFLLGIWVYRRKKIPANLPPRKRGLLLKLIISTIICSLAAKTVGILPLVLFFNIQPTHLPLVFAETTSVVIFLILCSFLRIFPMLRQSNESDIIKE